MKNNGGDLIREKFYEEIGKIKPLSDEHFKEIFEDENRFKEIVELILGRQIGDEIINLNGEFRLMVKGKAIRMDYLYGDKNEIINLEAQNETDEFPFKRQLFYWAVAYAHTLKRGEGYNTLRPCTSIVIYRNKDECALRQSAGLEGNLVETGDDKNQLTLISINAGKWKEEKNANLQCYLSLLVNGVLTPRNKKEFKGVNTESKCFRELNEYFMATSFVIRYNELEGKGGNEMVRDILSKFWTEDQKNRTLEEGREAGKEATAINAIKEGLSFDLIEKLTGFDAEKINKLKDQTDKLKH